MLVLKYVFVVLHIITAAAWFGLALPTARRARTAAVGGTGAAGIAADGVRTAKMLVIFSVLTLVFALGAFSLGIMAQGAGAYGWPFHTALLLILGLVAVSFGLIGPGWKTLNAGDSSGAKRVAMGAGIGHALWLIILVLMFWDDFQVAFATL